jgi:hypothetical protein
MHDLQARRLCCSGCLTEASGTQCPKEPMFNDPIEVEGNDLEGIQAEAALVVA